MDIQTNEKHKFLEDSHMSFQEVFDFAYKKLIPVLQGLAVEFGEEHFLDTLQKVAFECTLKAGQANASKLSRNDFAAFIDPGGEPSHFAKHVLTREIVDNGPPAFELKVTECLWAKTFREMGAADIGYALVCHTDFAEPQGFNPKITLVRSKTLMQGDDCCNHRFVWEG